MPRLYFDPPISAALWLALAAAAVVTLGWYAWRRPPSVTPHRWAWILTLMGLGTAAPLVVLLNPSWSRPIPPPAGRPVLTVLVDATASMAAPDAGGVSRYAAAASAAQRLTQSVGGGFDVRVRTFADTVRPADPEGLMAMAPEGDLSDLGAALTAGLDDDAPQGQAVVLLSDGIHNAGGESVLAAVRQAKALASPVFTCTLGGHHGGADVGVEFKRPQELAFTGQAVPLAASLTRRGPAGAGGRLAAVSLHCDGREVDKREVPLAAEGPTPVRFNVRQPASGVFRYEVRVEPWPNELTQLNNSALCLLRVVEEPIRVLLIEGKPYWDTKFLARTLAADPAVELTTAVRMTEGRVMRRRVLAAASQPAAATRPGADAWEVLRDPAAVLGDAAALKPFQVLVLGRDSDVFLTDAAVASVRDWVARSGGALVCYRGAPSSQITQRLAAMMPVRWAPARESRFRLELTETGREQGWLAEVGAAASPLSGMPTLATAALSESPKPLAMVLASGRAAAGEPAPAVTFQPYGSGRVVAIEGAGMWRWAFLAPPYQDHDETYREVWQNLLRWLASGAGLLPGQRVSLRPDRVAFGVAERAAATLLLRDDAAADAASPVIELRGSGEPQRVTPVPLGDEPGAFRVTFGKLPEGRYEARVVGYDEPAAHAAFDVRRTGRERLDLDARPDVMARIAEQTGGAVLEAADVADQLASRFEARLAATRRVLVQRDTAWDRGWVLAAVLALWSAGWALRRSGGLV